MLTTGGITPALHQRVKLILVAALLALSLTAELVGTPTQVNAVRGQPTISCDWYNQKAAKAFFDEDVGPSGYWDCYFFDEPIGK